MDRRNSVAMVYLDRMVILLVSQFDGILIKNPCGECVHDIG